MNRFWQACAETTCEGMRVCEGTRRPAEVGVGSGQGKARAAGPAGGDGARGHAAGRDTLQCRRHELRVATE